MKPPLLFLCHRIPYPPDKGDKIRSFHLLHHLSEHFDIYLATFVDDRRDWPWVPEVEKFCVDSLFVRLDPAVARLRSLRGLVAGEVLSLPYYRNAQMQQWVNDTVAEHSIAHVLVFSAAMAQYAMPATRPFARRVIDMVDVDSDKWQQYAQQKRWPMSWVYRRESRLLLAFERAVARQFDASLFVSSAEAALFRRLAPESAARVGFYNNGVNGDYFCPDAARENPYAPGERVLVFTGAMDYWPNIDAVTWFVQQVMPLLLLHHADLHFYIVGSSPTPAVRKLAKQPNVTVTGRVDDVRPYVQHARAAVAPMRIARGVQNKVLEGMAMARPVIVSHRGLEGINAIDGEQVLVADSAADNVACIERVLAGEADGVGTSARACIAEQFSWDRSLPEVVQLLAGATAADAPPDPVSPSQGDCAHAG